jgi:hypothetical protein
MEISVREILIPRIGYESADLRTLLAARRPAQITGFPLAERASRIFNQKMLLNQLGRFELTGARLRAGKLDISAAASFKVWTLRADKIIRNDRIWRDYYFSEPLSDLPKLLRNNIPYPFDCGKFLWARGRLWLSGDGSRTPLHRDIPHNIVFVTEGRKDVILCTPQSSSSVYSNSLFSKAPNFAQADLRHPDYAKFPRLERATYARLTLKAGEMLYIPPFWWHDILNRGPVTSLNYWFAPAGIYSLLALTSHTAKRLMGIYRNEWSKPQPMDAP